MQLATLLLLILSITSACVNDTITPEEPNPGGQYTDSEFVYVNLPGVMGISLTNTGDMSTRAETDPDNSNPTDNVGFYDGTDPEYRLATSGDHHFVVIYQAGQDYQKPLAIITLSTQGELEEDHNNNVTFLVKGLATQAEFAPRLSKIDDVKNMLKDNEAYVVLNFDKTQIYTEGMTESINLNGTNAKVLSSLYRNMFLSLPLKDPVISVEGKDYFTMSNSVYATSASAGEVVRDYTVYPDNVFDKDHVQDAKDNPAITAHVERLAVKYTVKFSPGTYKNGGDGEDSFNYDGYQGVDGSLKLPTYNVMINEYTGYTYTQQGYTVNSKEARAEVQILGYFVNNTEPSSYLLKNISSNTNYFNPVASMSTTSSWTDWLNYRSYWSEDPNYTFTAYLDDEHKSHAKGYPHQFRQALETDTVLYYHGVNHDTRAGYTWEREPHEQVVRKIIARDENGEILRDENNNVIYEDHTYDYYNNIGHYDYSQKNSDVVLRYRSFEEMIASYQSLVKNPDNAALKTEEIPPYPFYSNENTFHDPGMKTGSNTAVGQLVWNWQKAAYSAGTNLTVLAQMRIYNNGYESRTVYRGQNNIFYYELDGELGLLKSKLDIFNEVVLGLGNAGINILHAYFASHGILRTGDDHFDETNLDKVAWNEESVLWIGEVRDNGEEIRHWEAKAEDLTLIPAEISGGDGQCLIAPKRMGKNVKFYLAPVFKINNVPVDYNGRPVEDGNYVRDRAKSVEISFNHLVALIHKGIGPIDVFTDGKMYYSIPIPHRINTLNMTSKTDPSWRTLGNIGVVRNNWYEITVSNISDVGTPVHETAQPIVPVMDVKRNYINANVTVYGWHTISQGGVPLQ